MEGIYGVPPITPTSIPSITSTASATASPTVSILPPGHPTFEHITSFGHTTLWVTFAIMLISAIAFTAMSWRITVQKRIFHQLTTFIVIIATISYFSMAVGSGWVRHFIRETHEHKHDIPTTHEFVIRQLFIARYVDWLFTTPLLLVDLAFLSGMNGSNLVNVVVADVIMILTGMFAALGHSHKQKWGWYVIGWVSFATIIWNLATSARATAQRRGTQKLFVPLAVYTVVIWCAYPFIWAFAEGSHRMSPDSEVLAYAILDILAKPVFGFWLLIAHGRLPASTVNLGGVWSEGFGSQEGTLRVGDDDDA